MSTTTLIPKAARIEIPDPEPITSIDFINQIVSNIKEQLQTIDEELQKSSNGDNGQVRDIFQ